MHKTDGANHVANEFVDEVPGVSPGTVVEEDWLNTVQRELVNVVEGAGLVLDSGEDAQVLAALAMLFRGFMNLTFSTLATTKPNISGRVEVNGTWVPLDDVTPAGSPASPSSNWIYVSEAGAVSFDAANAPAWDVDLRGYYYGVLRAVAWVRVDSGGLYKYHHFLPLEQQSELIFEDIIEIGNWDMDATASLAIDHNLDPSKIIFSIVTVRKDSTIQSGNTRYPLNFVWSIGGAVQGWWTVSGTDPTKISMDRLASGYYDTDEFNEVGGYNRGWIFIKHKEL